MLYFYADLFISHLSSIWCHSLRRMPAEMPFEGASSCIALLHYCTALPPMTLRFTASCRSCSSTWQAEACFLRSPRNSLHVICRGLNANAHGSSMMFSVLFREAWGQWVRAGGFGNCCTRQLARMWLRWCGLYLALSVALHSYHGIPFCHSARWHLLCRRWCRTRLHLGGRSKCQKDFRDVWIPSISCFRVAHVANSDARRCISCFHGTTKHFHPIQ